MHTTPDLKAEEPGDASPGRAALARALPFLVVAGVAEASLIFLPSPVSLRDALLSTALLVATGLCLLLPWRSLPSWADVLIPLLFTASALMLMLAVGNSAQGVSLDLLAFLPIVWTALYLQPWKSAVVLGAVVVAQLMATLSPVALSDPMRIRRLVFWTVVGGLVVYSIGELRRRNTRMVAQRETQMSRREKSFEEFALSMARLERRNREVALLSELADVLHRCSTQGEAYMAIGRSAEKMFPEGGSLSIFDAGHDALVTRTAWGVISGCEQVFSPLDCRALGQGRDYESGPESTICAHLGPDEGGRSLCVPLVAHGENLGILRVTLPPAADHDSLSALSLVDDHRRQLARMAGEQIAILLGDVSVREELRNLSIRDPLTNLYNRRFMEETLSRVLQRTEGSLYEVSIVSIDVDHFKNFNDLYGHEVGDAVLRAIGDILLTQFRDSDVPCRSGGEEFTLILPGSSPADTEARVAELQRLVAGLRITVGGREVTPPLPPTLSFGIATFPAHGASADVLLRVSDRALYAAKAAGRNRVVLATAPA
jgi:diguanylate cyclase (GGDEF)-like protein